MKNVFLLLKNACFESVAWRGDVINGLPVKLRPETCAADPLDTRLMSDVVAWQLSVFFFFFQIRDDHQDAETCQHSLSLQGSMFQRENKGNQPEMSHAVTTGGCYLRVFVKRH